MEDFSAFKDGERALLLALERHGVRFMIVGLSAAVLQGANAGTRDIDLWFETLGSFGMRPPQIGGDTVGDRLDIVTHMHGLGTFAEEYPNAIEMEVDGIRLQVLRLDRIIASKRASDRAKDRAALPALEEALAVQRDKDADE
jgi:hypothetical protein